MYEQKESGYFSYCRADLLELIPRNRNNRVLEIGAGSGETLRNVKECGLAEYVVGVDVTEVKDSSQSHPAMDRFIIGDIENLALDLEEGSFDVILCGDVLEHLRDPWRTLERLRPLLRTGGLVIASVPNVRYWKVSMGLFWGGQWNYCDEGILDRTHLRFFVKQSVLDLFTGAGFRIVTLEKVGPQRKWGMVKWAINLLTLGLLSDLLTVQYIIVASNDAR